MIAVTSCEIVLVVNSLLLTGCEFERLCPKVGCFFPFSRLVVINFTISREYFQ